MAERNHEVAALLGAALAPARRDEQSAGHPDDAAFERYLSRRATEQEVAMLEGHFAGCPQCAEDLVAAGRVEAEAADHALPEMRRSRARPHHTILWRLAAGLVLVVAASVGLGIASRFTAARLEPVIVSRLTELTMRDVSATGAALVLASGPGLELEGLRMAEDPRFSRGDFLRIANATLSFEPGALLRGRLRARIALTDPLLRLERDAAGEWNVETMGSRASRRKTADHVASTAGQREPARSAKGAADDAEPRFEVASATIRNGTLEIASSRPGTPALRIGNVDLSFTGSATSSGRVTLAGNLPGQGNRIAVRGEVGPFGVTAPPRYRLEEVAFSHVPVANLPGAPQDLEGELSFTGDLDSSGRTLDAVVQAARGAGDLAICCGALGGRNLIADLVARLGATGQPATGGPSAALERAREQAAFTDLLLTNATTFAQLGGRVDLVDGTLHFAHVALDAGALQATAGGTLERHGSLDARGEVRLSRELSAIIVAAAPQSRPLLAKDDTLRLPFRVAGVWPDVQLTLDADRGLARLLPWGATRALDGPLSRFAMVRFLPRALGIG